MTALKVLVLGANGQVGRAILDLAQQKSASMEIVGLDSRQLDITAEKQVHGSIEEIRPSVVINAAAYTAVDQAEKEPEKAFAVNRDGARYIAEACARQNTPLLHVSTDYIFDGSKPQPYLETDTPNPINVYGASKWAGEQAIQQTLEQHLILRTSWVFGVYGKNFVYSMIKLAQQREELRIVNDQHGCPTAAQAIASVLLAVAESTNHQSNENCALKWGVYHYAGEPATTWFEFARAAISTTQSMVDYKVKNILPIASSEFPTPARRPQNSVLDTGKIRVELGIQPQPWQTGLEQMINHEAFMTHVKDNT